VIGGRASCPARSHRPAARWRQSRQPLAASRKPCFLARIDLTPAPGLCPRGGVMTFARWESGFGRHLDGAAMGTTKARRRERYAQDPDYRARQRAHWRTYYRAHKQELNERSRAYYRAHKQEMKERSRAYYQAHKQDLKPILRRGQLKRLYGLSPADYDALLAKQDGVCAICGKPPEETLCVDHCHATGTIRGLLCRKCNIALGCNDDDRATIMTSLAYLGSGCRDSAGAAAQRALVVRAALRTGRARMILVVEPYRRKQRGGQWTAGGVPDLGRVLPIWARSSRDATIPARATPPPPSSRPRRPAPPGGADRGCAAPGSRQSRR